MGQTQAHIVYSNKRISADKMYAKKYRYTRIRKTGIYADKRIRNKIIHRHKNTKQKIQ